ncbi:MAG: hypothetical protein WCE38_19595 [Burkholderiales bacterium]
MKPVKLESRRVILALSLFAGVTILTPIPALSQTPVHTSDQALVLSQNRFHLAQYRQCPQQVGPYATQSTAWQRLREAQSRGYSVSNGVTPCYAGSARGYCFYAYVPC